MRGLYVPTLPRSPPPALPRRTMHGHADGASPVPVTDSNSVPGGASPQPLDLHPNRRTATKSLKRGRSRKLLIAMQFMFNMN